MGWANTIHYFPLIAKPRLTKSRFWCKKRSDETRSLKITNSTTMTTTTHQEHKNENRQERKDRMDIELYIQTETGPWLKKRVRDNPWYMLLVMLIFCACLTLGLYLNHNVLGSKNGWPIIIAGGLLLLLWSMINHLFTRAAKRSKDYVREKFRVVDHRLNYINGRLEDKGVVGALRSRFSAQRLIAELTKKALGDQLCEEEPRTKDTPIEGPHPEPVEGDQLCELNHPGDAELLRERRRVAGVN